MIGKREIHRNRWPFLAAGGKRKRQNGSNNIFSIRQYDFKSTDARKGAQDLSSLAWAHSLESSNNFISDFYTKPTLPMLEAIINTTLGDGDNDEDASTNSLQNYVAGLLGHEAALLVPTGTMGN